MRTKQPASALKK